MRLKLLSSLMGASLACLFASGLAAQPLQPSAQGMQASPIDPSGAKTAWRWIGIREKGLRECPEIKLAGWSSRPLMARTFNARQILEDWFEGERDWSEEQKEEYADLFLLHRLGLDRFCLYTRDSGNVQFAAPEGLKKAEPDRMALSASGLHDMVSPGLADHFRGQTRGGSPATLVSDEPRVRLTFIDSHPDGDGLPSRPLAGSLHGYSLARLARELVCHGDRCAATFGTRRALRYNSASAPVLSLSPTDGSGRVGLVSELADAIVAEVLKWRRDGESEHLILNISLGWDGEIFNDLDARKASKLDPSARAVYDALRFAARRGVLVIAAAGNRRGGPEPSTLPLLPAAWELRRPCGLPFGLGRKLVYAAGGVDWQSLPLPNFRHGGRPRRSAFGDHAVATASDGSTAILTGSSVSAAVVSSIAAVVWHLRPELHPDQVMSLIGRSGRDLEVRADFYPWRSLSFLPAPRQRRLSLCNAVQRACRPGAGRCPGLTALPACGVSEEPPPLPEFASVPSVEWTSPPVRPERPCDARMSLRTRLGEGMPSAPCPTDQFGSVANQRWLFPQPDAVPCPGCAVVPDPPLTRVTSLTPAGAPSTASSSDEKKYLLRMEIAPEWLSSDRLKSATLDIDCFEGGVLVERMTYPVFREDLGPPSGTLTLPNLGDGRSLQDCTAQLNFVVEAGGTTMSVQNPVVLNPGP